MLPIPLVLAEGSLEPFVEDFLQQGWRRRSQAESQNVRVIPDPRTSCRFRISAKCGANSGQFVGRDGAARSRPAGYDGLVGIAAANGVYRFDGDVGPVRCASLLFGTKVQHFVTSRLERVQQIIDEVRTFVGTDGYFHDSQIPFISFSPEQSPGRVSNIEFMPDFPTIRDIAAFLEDWAPRASAQPYDNVGLQVGDPTVAVRRALLALDMTPQVLDEAASAAAELIITHHPLIFRPLRSVTPTSFSSNLAYRLAASGIALYSIHTNLDAASGGVSFALARRLGISDLEFLQTFEIDGEEVGLGVVGKLDVPLSLAEFLARASERLETPALRFVGAPEMLIERAAVCGGAGADLLPNAIAANADVFLTADLKYHQFFDALDIDGHPTIALVDAGHYETEVVTEELLREELSMRFPEVEWRRTSHRTSPVRSFVQRG